VSGIELSNSGGNFSIVNNLIGLDDASGLAVAAPNYTGIDHQCCANVTNVIVSNYAGISIYYDNGSSITGNIFGGDPSGTALLGYGSYGISLYYAYGA